MLRLFKFLHPEIFRYKDLHAEAIQKVRSLKDEAHSLHIKIKELETSLKLLTAPFISDDLVIAKIAHDKAGNEILITVTEEFANMFAFINVIAYDVSPTGGKHKIGCLWAKKNSGYLHITDIQSLRENVGLGSMMMQTLFRFVDYRNKLAKVTEVAIKFHNPFRIEFISGNLKYVDRNNLNKLVPFYQKHDFQVSLNTIEQTGEIYRSIKPEL